MDKGRVAGEVDGSRRIDSPIARGVCRLISVCLAYSVPALAHEPARDVPQWGLSDVDRTERDHHVHDGDHDRDDDEHRDRGHGDDHDHHPTGGGSCHREPTGTAIWNSAASNAGTWNTASDWTGTSTVPSGNSAVAEFGSAKTFTVNYNTTSSIGTLQFDAGAPAYTFNIGSGNALTLAGTGIDNRSSSVPVFNVSGRLNFTNAAGASTAALVANAGGVIDFSGMTAATVNAGSVAGAGTFALGKTSLTVGSLGTSTTVSGVIQDGGVSGGAGGSLTKLGSGTLTLTGAETYTGATAINSGMLAVTGGGRLEGTSGITLGQNAADNGTLYVSGTTAKVTTTGSIIAGNAGTGTLTIEGGATVTAGSIVLGASAGAKGILNIGSGSAAGMLTVPTITSAVGATGVVNLNEIDSTYTLSSSLRNTLTLNQNGPGTTILTGTNTYTGGTNLNAGILRVSSNANLGGTGGGLTFNGGTLQLSGTLTNLSRAVLLNSGGGKVDTGSFSLTSAGTIGGVGALTKLGSGTLTLSGISTYAGGTVVSAGTLRGTTDSLQGNILDNGNVTFAQVADGAYAGVMSGTGSLTKLSAGNLTISGANTYSGVTTVSGGTLTVNGTVSSPFTVGNSGILAGTGALSGPVTVSGMLSPGSATTPFGILTIKGSLQLASGSVLQVSTDAAGQNSRVNVTGTAIMDGSISVLAGSSNYSANTRYTVLTASNGLTVDGPTAIATDMAFLTPSVASDANNLYVTLTRNGTAFNAVAKSTNERATANYMQSFAAASAGDSAAASGSQSPATQVLNRVMQMTAAQARNSFAQLGGSDLTQLSLISRINTTRVIDMLDDRLSHLTQRGSDFDAPEFRASAADLYAQSKGIAFSGGSTGGGFWTRSLGTGGANSSRTATGGNDAPAAFDWYGSGLAFGFDHWMTSDALVGVSASYTTSDADLNSMHSARGQIRTPQLTIYTSLLQGGLQFRGVLGYARDFYDSNRGITLGNDRVAATAVHGANELSGYLEVNDSFQGPYEFQLQPLVALRLVDIDENAFTERGSVGSLAVEARDTRSLGSDAGFRIIRPLTDLAGAVELRTIWTHTYGENLSAMTAHLAGDQTGGSFTVQGGSLERDTLQFGGRVTARLRMNLLAHLDYSLQMQANNSAQQFLSLGASYVW